MKSTVPIYTDDDDMKGNSVRVEIDIGPGIMNTYICAYIQRLGVTLFTSVTNYTGVTKETDNNYGWFKLVLKTYLP